MSLWSLDNPAFTDYAFYAGVLAAKVMAMGFITGYYRMTKKAFVNPEDAKNLGGKDFKVQVDADVERVRRAHQNDLENITVFWILGLLFLLTNPSPATARLIFRIYTGSRIGYTILYIRGSYLRPGVYIIGVICNIFMLYRIICTFW
ncbi:hypothetical protein Pmani_026187 [Petrolisthes manimaculis]|uniref:Microsomal glutathione S-transferase 1 n=1 Tax=Petrolisthes manimaculis TaxID=1843537 RepID=A0AAE1TWW2_9EUCA|nr:hypothetical protein Pmani_026187 [Petrolisthes manimaculis]